MNREAKPGKTVEKTFSFFIVGLLQNRAIEYSELCENEKIYQLHYYRTFVDFLLHLVTLSIYSPKTLEVTCEASNNTLNYDKDEKRISVSSLKEIVESDDQIRQLIVKQNIARF
ncbi:MAG: hypothetical protein O9264_02875 [Leptospira sp.]|nr:hypothetical protein [Leptospira sp.]